MYLLTSSFMFTDVFLIPRTVPGTWQMPDTCLLNECKNQRLNVEHKEMSLIVSKADCDVGMMENAKSRYKCNPEIPSGLGEGYR